jgi:hypothetical protein
VAPHEGRYRITKVGLALLGDGAARVNVAFVHDVCYLGAHRLEDSLREARPAGLEALVAASSTATPPPATVYEALAHLPAAVRRSWFAFDHFYSDRAFPAALPRLLARSPRHLLDVGGNTGRFALLALAASPALRVTVADLPGQLAEAEAAFVAAGVGERTALAPVDLLDPHAALPKGADAVWMSQLLSCFSLPQATGILRRAREAVAPGGRVFVLDTPWDQQRTAVARLCLQATSVYFACIANGQSKMHGAAELRACIAEAGLTLEEEATGLGASHTLWICR